MRIWIPIFVILAAGGGAGYWYYYKKPGEPVSPIASVRFADVTRGPISVVVNATGQLQPVTQVDVGTQVSGLIEKINVDFNSPVKAGDKLAQLNTDNLDARVATNRANKKRAEASHERLIVEHANADRQAKRLADLNSKGIISKVDLENSEILRDSLAVQVKVALAEIEQAKTTLQQSEIDLQHATILSPIDGIVIQKAVEVGQTVASSFNSPLLFQIANDLTKMQIRANIDEADIGRVQKSKKATFTVDAFQGRVFEAKLEQVRLNPAVTSNVVIYTCIFSVNNLDEAGQHQGPLLPGLTANLTILIDDREDAVIVPAAALRFQPKSIPGLNIPIMPGAPAESRANNTNKTSMPGNGNGNGTKPVNLTIPANTATVWIRDGDTLKSVIVKTGLSDGNGIEILGNLIKAGDQVAIGVATTESNSNTGSFSPFGGMGNRPRGMGR
ncbi:MAG: efflux RND transporter periplasmic adaptor subunit [Planctomycetota bacterium]